MKKAKTKFVDIPVTVQIVVWTDSAQQHGDVSEEELTKGYAIVSIGNHINEDEDVMRQSTDRCHDGSVREVATIRKENIKGCKIIKTTVKARLPN